MATPKSRVCAWKRAYSGSGPACPSVSRGSSASHAWMRAAVMSCLGTLGLIVPANTARPSSSFVRANDLASDSVAKVLVSRGLRCFGSVPLLRTSKVTYHVGVIAHPPTHHPSPVDRGAPVTSPVDLNQDRASCCRTTAKRRPSQQDVAWRNYRTAWLTLDLRQCRSSFRAHAICGRGKAASASFISQAQRGGPS
jgi:hypothetical protein